MLPHEIKNNIILRAVVGSTVHGLHLAGRDDRDEMGIYIEPPENIIGLQSREHYIERTQPEGVRSGPGDLDLTLYSVRKWMRLALKGNPTVLLLLFAPPMVETEAGTAIKDAASIIISKQAGMPFLGYLRAQKDRLLGVGGRKPTAYRPELIEEFGYDTKYMMHACRLGVQGIELMTTGRLSLPMPEPYLSDIRTIREGKQSFEQAMAYLDDVEQQLLAAVSSSTLRSHPDHRGVDNLLVTLYRKQWGWRLSELYG